jgi:hypothetical protein
MCWGGGRGEKIGKRLRKKDERERITGIFKLKGKLRLKDKWNLKCERNAKGATKICKDKMCA